MFHRHNIANIQKKANYNCSGTVQVTDPHYYGAATRFAEQRSKAFDNSSFEKQIKAVSGNTPPPPPMAAMPVQQKFNSKIVGVAGGQKRPEFPAHPPPKAFDKSPFARQIYGYQGENYYAVNENRLSVSKMAELLALGTSSTENIGGRILQEHMSFLPSIFQKITSNPPMQLSASEIIYLDKHKIPATPTGIQMKVQEIGPYYGNISQSIFGAIPPPASIGIPAQMVPSNNRTPAETFNPRSRSMEGDIHGSFGVEGVGEPEEKVEPLMVGIEVPETSDVEDDVPLMKLKMDKIDKKSRDYLETLPLDELQALQKEEGDIPSKKAEDAVDRLRRIYKGDIVVYKENLGPFGLGNANIGENARKIVEKVLNVVNSKYQNKFVNKKTGLFNSFNTVTRYINKGATVGYDKEREVMYVDPTAKLYNKRTKKVEEVDIEEVEDLSDYKIAEIS